MDRAPGIFMCSIQVLKAPLLGDSIQPYGCNASVLQCPAAEAAQRTAKELSFGLPSQAVRF